jgi:hypothetical protein
MKELLLDVVSVYQFVRKHYCYTSSGWMDRRCLISEEEGAAADAVVDVADAVADAAAAGGGG